MLVLPAHLANIEAKLLKLYLLTEWGQSRYATWMHHASLFCHDFVHLCLGCLHTLHHCDELFKSLICRFRWLLIITGRLARVELRFPTVSLLAVLECNRSQRSRLIRCGHLDPFIVTFCDSDPPSARLF